MNSDELRKTLVEWLSEIKEWHPSTEQSWDDYILTDQEWKDAQWLGDHPKTTEARPDWFHLVLYTETHLYRIVVINKEQPIMMASVHNRKARAGESWLRGNDLTDGPFCKETFQKIIYDMFAYELIAKVKPSPAKADISEVDISNV